MKIAIALTCLLALFATAQGIEQVEHIADLDVAEHHASRNPGYGGQQAGNYGGNRGGHSAHLNAQRPYSNGPAYSGGRGHRSVKENLPNVLSVQPFVQDVVDIDVAESRRTGGHYAGQGGGHRHGNAGGHRGGHSGGHGGHAFGRKRRSLEDDDVIDLEAAEHHAQGYGSYGGYGNSGGYGNNGYGNNGYGNNGYGNNGYGNNGYGNNGGYGGGYNSYPGYGGQSSNNYGSYGGHNQWGR
ncbi:ctenidin-1-like [Daphnia carinata]|uniref:ctenidin-1-like n=1 Tax=Daphnia carinata TaxID=120202 RepID=UPI00257D44E8|nr:ctenidin-1-like [Daphnia carinata]